MTRNSLACGEKKDCEKKFNVFSETTHFLNLLWTKIEINLYGIYDFNDLVFSAKPIRVYNYCLQHKIRNVFIANKYKNVLVKNIFYFLFSDPRSSITPNLALIEVGPSINASDSSHGIASRGNAQTNVLCKMNITHLIL